MSTSVGGDKAFLNFQSILDFINSYKITGRAFRDSQGDNDSLNVILKDIEKRKREAEKQEEAFYSLFDIHPSNLSGLQKMVNYINTSNLRYFTNEVITDAQPFESTDWRIKLEETDIVQNFNEFWTKEINKEEIQNEIVNTYGVNKSIAPLIQYLYKNISSGREIRGENKKVVRGNIVNLVKKIIVDYNTNNKTNDGAEKIASVVMKDNQQFKKMLQKIITRTYRKDFITGVAGQITENSFDIDLDFTTFDENLTEIEQLFSKYPYYNLSSEAKKIANSSDGDIIWKNFKNYLFDLLKVPMLKKSKFNSLMEQIGRKNFIERSNSQSGVIGILGELATGILFTIIFKKDIGIIQLVGDDSINGEKPAVDIIFNTNLGNFGGQVKNYHSYSPSSIDGGSGLVGSRGYNLKSNDIGWETIVNRIENDPNIISIEKWLSIVCYNRPVKVEAGKKEPKNLENYKSNYSLWTAPRGEYKQSFNSVLIQNYDAFFGQEMETSLGSSLPEIYRNTFYIFGGEFVIPTSKILEAIYKKIKNVREALLDEQKRGIKNSFTATYDYKGNLFWALGTERKDLPNLKSILNSLTVRLNLNLYLPELDLPLTSF